MGFEIVKPGEWQGGEPLAEGQCSIDKRGRMILHVADVERHIGRANYLIVLADPSTRRVGLRAVRDGEQPQSMACSVVNRKTGKDSGRRAVNILPALRKLKMAGEAAAGRYELTAMQEPGKDALLTVNLSGASQRGTGKK